MLGSQFPCGRVCWNVNLSFFWWTTTIGWCTFKQLCLTLDRLLPLCSISNYDVHCWKSDFFSWRFFLNWTKLVSYSNANHSKMIFILPKWIAHLIGKKGTAINGSKPAFEPSPSIHMDPGEGCHHGCQEGSGAGVFLSHGTPNRLSHGRPF